MFSSSNIVILLIVGAVAAVYLASQNVEGFWNIPSRTWKVERVFEEQTPNGPDFFQTPNFQGILSPRFSNADYGANLRTQLPNYDMFGVPADPLGGDFGGSFYASQSAPKSEAKFCNGVIVEGFENGAPNQYAVMNQSGSQGQYAFMNQNGLDDQEFFKQRISTDKCNPSGYANGNYKRIVASLTPVDTISDNQNPPQGSFGSYLNADGELKQPIIYDRYIYANRHSRLRAQGDPIRGDLPIVPNSGNWFTPSVHPNIDLQAGAINVLAGVNNETNHQLASLIYASSGGGDSTIGGVDLMPLGGTNAFSTMNMGTRNDVTMSAGSDVIVRSFP